MIALADHESRVARMKTWGANWDGEGAPAPDTGALDAAGELLGLLDGCAERASLMLDADGKPLILMRSPGIEVEITVVQRHEIDFVILSKADDSSFGVPFDGQTVPPELSRALTSVGIAVTRHP